MKILYFTNIPAPYKIDFLNSLSKEFEIHCVFNTINNEKRDNRWYENNYFKFKTFHIGFFGFIRLIQLVEFEKYDFIINDNYASISGAVLPFLSKKNAKYIINVEGGFIKKNETALSKFLKTFFLTKADYVLSSGKEANKYLNYYGVKDSKIEIYPFSSLHSNEILDVPVSYDKKLLLRQLAGYNYQTIFVSVGRYIKSKAYNEFLINVAPNFVNDSVAFLIIGSGEEKSAYINTIKKNRLNNVYLIDFCNKEEIFKYLQMSDVFFFPSFSDTWGLVINEAMANGLPVISSNLVLASCELLDDEFLYDGYNFAQLTKLIQNFIIKNKKSLYYIGKSNIRKIHHYTIQNMANTYINFLRGLIENEK